ncbi:lysine transporter LysE [Kocuria sp. WRN011]|uniref:LysE family translocator n=1 Tax=Kocuria sp. WRN011 TaxID=2029858 RepID=UPI000BAF2E68|nr:LysE family translocator [Kocuria sp. WRN011]PBB09045.1 lysine transporter LysE [Kocuria sp. WRN011]
MEQFAAVAVAHFLALLIPGVDFFLIVRTALTHGWRNATGACLGIAIANGVFIAGAFVGVALISNPVVLDTIQMAGGIFLIFIGIAFLRSNPVIAPDRGTGVKSRTWLRNFGLGLASGLLNPKNAMFYVSLAAAVSTATPLSLVLYGAWMFAVVLVWDVFVAVVLGSRHSLGYLQRILPWISRFAGVFLVLFGGSMVIGLVLKFLG